MGAFPTSASQYQNPAALDLLEWAVSKAGEYDLEPIPEEVFGYLLSLSPVRAVTVLFQLEEVDPMEESPDMCMTGRKRRLILQRACLDMRIMRRHTMIYHEYTLMCPPFLFPLFL